MNELTKYLYEFLLEYRMVRLLENEEYKACSSAIRLQEEKVKSCLNGEQYREVILLAERIVERSCVEDRYLFQATLELLRELNGLVRA